MKPAIPAVVLALTLSALTVQAADSISGASRRTAKSAAVIPKNIDAVTSASVVPQALRQSVKPNRFSLRPGVKRVSSSWAIREANLLNGISSIRP